MVDVAGENVAFLISHPWTYENPAKLNSEEFTLPSWPDVFFIHSVTVMKAYQKFGIGSALAKAAIQSYGFSHLTLISVQNSISFWEKLGFNRAESLPQSVWQALNVRRSSIACDSIKNVRTRELARATVKRPSRVSG
jgi:N-acetylglutamate synthase-like GNAT family acetyltransferase